MLRHRWPLRLMHWVNLACMLAMVGSGLQILNAHPALYWGEASNFAAPLASTKAVQRGGELHGVTQVGNTRFDSTGLLGATNNPNGVRVRAVAPSWAMIPGSRNLAVGRRWHFFFAWAWVINGCTYLLWSLASRHLQRDLAMRRRDWREIPKSIIDHLRFRHPVGEEAMRYNPLQKLAYLGVIFVLTPLIVLTGLSMSPQLDPVMGGFIELVGGRQSARTLHFIVMSSFLIFAAVHLLMVVYAGPINEMRSMLSGRFRIRTNSQSKNGGPGNE
ncbi:cytochrome b/b6 domain-containing protein [Thermomonas sp.]|uniref:cytochrome b/b6 domain-containing protein n=1 Tax=Thermomonas sp. TaxID=1971895 RepID=UPI0024896396|nr:cytochrome b/b6 domain-containing protein [Thermomonas sp.]MDI1253625.1 cytochrome b/b6 domain-containing protein [Thermomonas sp.]